MELELRMNEAAREFIFDALGILIDRIEACGASPALTQAVILASGLRGAIGNKWNPPDPNDAARVLQILREWAETPK